MFRFTVIIILCLCLIPIFAEVLPAPPPNFEEDNAGLQENPFQIETIENLRWVSETQEYWGDADNSFWFEQTSDIDAIDTGTWNDGKGFSPIGLRYLTFENGSEEPTHQLIPFFGQFNGNNHQISNLFINRIEEFKLCHGLFGYTVGAHLSNIKLTGANITTTKNSGILIGLSEETTILSCSTTGTISGEMIIGGLIGNSIESSTSQCYSSANVSADSNSGGLIGGANSSQISDCYSSGTLNTSESTNGGVIGNLSSNSALTNSYFNGENQSEIIGGIVGVIRTGSIISNCFWDITTSSVYSAFLLNYDDCLVETEGLDSNEMQNQNTYLEADWDFTTIWNINSDLNRGYPYLRANEVTSNLSENVTLLNSFNLSNYPNPFNPETTIYFSLDNTEDIELTIYNVKGQKVKSLLKKRLNNGVHSIVWNGKDENNDYVASAIYFYSLVVGKQVTTKKMILTK